MIAVTGATGQLGRLVIAALRERQPDAPLVALARDPAKAADQAAAGVTLRRADYTQPDTLVPALAGVDRLLLISGSEIGQRLPQHRAVIEAAQTAGVAHIVYTSLLHAGRSPMALAAEHKATEALLAASGLSVTLLRNGWYAENYAGSIAAAPQHHAILGSAGQGRISAASRADLAAAAAVVLTTEGHAGKTYELGADSAFTMADLAAMVATAAGTDVAYVDLPQAEYRAKLEAMGLPGPFAEILADSDAQAAKGWLYTDSGDLARLIGRPATPMSETVTSLLAA